VAILDRPAFPTAVTGYPVSATVGHEVLSRSEAGEAAHFPAATDDGGEPLAGTADGSAG
jgi:hypothetical protein